MAGAPGFGPGRNKIPYRVGGGQTVYLTQDEYRRIKQSAASRKAAEKIRDGGFVSRVATTKIPTRKAPAAKPPAARSAAPTPARPWASGARTPAPKTPAQVFASASPGAANVRAGDAAAAKANRTSTARPAAPVMTARQQALADVTAAVDPQLKALLDAITARSNAAASGIRGYGNELARNLSGMESSADRIYDDAKAENAAANASVAQVLSGQGTQLSAQLADRLKGINSPAVQAAADQVAQTGQGAAGAAAGMGDATLRALIAKGAAAREYGSKLPGIARLGAAQDANLVGLQAQREIADETARIRGQIPGLVLDRTGQIESDQAKRQALAQEAEALGLKTVQQTVKDQQAQANRDRQFRLSFASAFGYDPADPTRKTVAQQRLEQSARTNSEKWKTGGLTATQKRTIAKDAATIAKEAWYGVPADENGVPTNNPDHFGGYIHKTYQEAMRDMLAEGVPLAVAQKALNAYWAKPGMTAGWEKSGQGRPKVPFQQRGK